VTVFVPVVLLVALCTVSIVAGFRQRAVLSRSAVVHWPGVVRPPSTWPRIARVAFSSERRTVALAVWLMVLDAALALAAPWPVKIVIDNVLLGRPLPSFLAGLRTLPSPVSTAVVAASGVLMLATSAVVAYLVTYLVTSVAERTSSRLRVAATKHVLSAPPRSVADIPHGELVNRVTSDTVRISDTIIAMLETLLPEAIVLAGMLAITALLDWRLALVVVAVIPIFAGVSRGRNRAVHPAQTRSRARAGELAAFTTDLLSRLPAVHVFGRAHTETEAFTAASDEAALASARAVDAGARYAPTLDTLPGLALAGALIAGAVEVSAGRLSVGGLVVFLAYLSSLTAPVAALAQLSATVTRGRASLDRLTELFTMPAKPRGVEPVAAAGRVRGAPTIEFDDVGFARSGAVDVLDGFSTTVYPGEFVCLSGRSGSGKSTLLALLTGLLAPDSGTIRVDGRDLASYSENEVRRLVSLVPQDPWLHTGTILDNIRYGRPEATRSEAIAAAEQAGVDEFARGLPGGYDTEIGEHGVALSGGQQRRVAVARAFLCETPILLLDEPTNGLDAVTERRLVERLRLAARGRTVVLVTHARHLERIADRVIHLEAARQPVAL
jgi:ABC-type multidrug transport system fused ATPase/permease subunit